LPVALDVMLYKHNFELVKICVPKFLSDIGIIKGAGITQAV
jgi:hypothetical protein